MNGDSGLVRLDDTTRLTDYDEISEVLRSPRFVQAAFGPAVHPLVAGTLNALDGPDHSNRRRLENQLFTREAIAHYKAAAVEPLLRSSLEALRAEPDADGVVRADLVPLIWRIARQVPALIVGIDDVEEGASAERFIRQVSTMAHAFTASLSVDREALVAAGLAARRAFADEFLHPSVERRRALVAACEQGELDRAALPRDLVTLLLLHWDEEWDDDLLVREATVFLGASISTTAQSFPHLIVRLDEWVGRDPERAARLVDIDFLQGAVAESTRLFVASPARLRRATEDVTLRSGRLVRRGETVSLWFVPANTDPGRFGEDAASFDPLRDTGAGASWGLAFGHGPHLCIGKPMITGVRGGDGDATHGVTATVAHALYLAGMRLDPDRPATKDPASIYDEYATCPVVFHGEKIRTIR